MFSCCTGAFLPSSLISPSLKFTQIQHSWFLSCLLPSITLYCSQQYPFQCGSFRFILNIVLQHHPLCCMLTRGTLEFLLLAYPFSIYKPSQGNFEVPFFCKHHFTEIKCTGPPRNAKPDLAVVLYQWLQSNTSTFSLLNQCTLFILIKYSISLPRKWAWIFQPRWTNWLGFYEAYRKRLTSCHCQQTSTILWVRRALSNHRFCAAEWICTPFSWVGTQLAFSIQMSQHSQGSHLKVEDSHYQHCHHTWK